MTLRPGPYREFQNDRVYAAVEAFRHVAAERAATPAALALAWLLTQDDVATVVAGPAHAGQLDAVVEALELRLEPGEVDELAAVFA